VWRNPLVRKGRFALTIGADYVALIIPHGGELFVEATSGLHSTRILTFRCSNGNVELHDKSAVKDGLLV
jgi:hypothetical protein